MTMREATPSAGAVRRARPRPALRDVTRLPVPPVSPDGPGAPELPSNPPAAADAGSAYPGEHAEAVASIEAQVRQIEALLAAVREGVGSLARAGLERQVDLALHDGHEATRPAVRPARPSATHPAQAAVERASLLEAVENRAVIEQAKGMLMLKHRCDADSAFGLLVEISRRERRKVRDIAGDIVRSGSAPRRVVDVTDAAVSSGRVADQVRAH
jgi:ANTAR domain